MNFNLWVPVSPLKADRIQADSFVMTAWFNAERDGAQTNGVCVLVAKAICGSNLVISQQKIISPFPRPQSLQP